MIAYIDYAKAFDSVSHSKLIIKLQAYGITGDLLNWVKNFLCDRHQCTRVGQCCSGFRKIVSIVVKGSVIGPLLFTLYINDVVDIFVNSANHSRDCSVQMYADDLKIYTVIDSAEDVTQFQRHLDALVTWSHKWQLYISSKKCNLLYCGSIDGPDVLIDGSVICKAHCVRDLGVLVDPQLKFMVLVYI